MKIKINDKMGNRRLNHFTKEQSNYSNILLKTLVNERAAMMRHALTRKRLL